MSCSYIPHITRQELDATNGMAIELVKPISKTPGITLNSWRLIDEILGIWTWTRRQFDLFLQRLNTASQQFGIQFGDFQFGKSVDYLDLTISLGLNNRLEYKLFKKETDARLYLQTDSFHPRWSESSNAIPKTTLALHALRIYNSSKKIWWRVLWPALGTRSSLVSPCQTSGLHWV